MLRQPREILAFEHVEPEWAFMCAVFTAAMLLEDAQYPAACSIRELAWLVAPGTAFLGTRHPAYPPQSGTRLA